MLRSEGLRSRFYRDSLYTEPVEVNAIPYFLWANRGLAEMTVWIPSDPSLSEPLDKVSFSQMARVSGSGGVSLSAVNDLQFGPEKAPVFLWPEPQDTVWIRYDFPDEEEFSATGVYWYTSDSKPPNDWKILALVEGKWHAVYNYLKPWGTEPGMMNRVLFETVRTRSLRLEVRKEPGQQCGVIEWEVD
jgi:hypothetical protein